LVWVVPSGWVTVRLPSMAITTALWVPSGCRVVQRSTPLASKATWWVVATPSAVVWVTW
jgi:hypothetical protein